MPNPQPAQSRRKIALIVLPAEPGRKHNHLAMVKHRGGGWYEIVCFGSGKKCKAGECKHTANLAWGKPGGRRVRQVARD